MRKLRQRRMRIVKQKEAEENKRLLAAQEKAKQDSTAKAEADRLKKTC